MVCRVLRESVEELREMMYSASAYPGPEPGKMWSLDAGVGRPQGNIFRDREQEEKAEKEKAMRKRRADYRGDLRKLSLWLQQKHNR